MMKFFVDANGVIFSINENGKSNHPSNIKIDGDSIHILDDKGFVLDTYALWSSLHSLAAAISPKIEINADEELNIHDAVEELHQAAERFKQDWLDGHKENPSLYPLSIPSDNHGLFNEQFFISLSDLN